MKIRIGFVSNSSSSSFVVVTTRKNFEEVLKKLKPASLAIVKKILDSGGDVIQKKKIFGKDLAVVCGLTGQGGSIIPYFDDIHISDEDLLNAGVPESEVEEIGEDVRDYMYDYWHEFVDQLGKDKSSGFSVSMSD